MPPAPDQGPDSPDDERFLTNFNHYRSADMHARRLGYRIYHGLLQNNDSFRFETVQPGTYLLTLHAGKADTVVATREVTIPPPDRQPDPSPIDLGTLGPSAP
jgi:hypothetical protein